MADPQYLSTDPNAGQPIDPSMFRSDGSLKGQGFLGPLQRPDGKQSTEISIGVNIDGREVEIPTLVPTLSPRERQWLINNDVSDPSKIPQSIVEKAAAHARQRIAAGQSPFAGQGESPSSPAGAVRRQISGSMAQRPMFEPGAGAAMLGALSEPGDVASGALGAINPLNWLRGAVESGRLAFNPSEIPDAANAALTQTLEHPGAAAGGAITGSAMSPLLGQIPAGRIARAGGAGMWAGAQRMPFVGAPLKAGVEAALEAWTQKAAPAARVAGKAPALNDVLTDALNEARQAPKPTRVSLPGGDTYRAEGAVPSAANARPAPAATPRASAPPSAAPKTSGAAPSTPAPPPGPVPRQAAVAAKLKLSPREFEAFQGLVDQGYEPQQVLKAIEGQRAAQALQQRFGTPTNAEVDAAVADRNATGRWPQDRR